MRLLFWTQLYWPHIGGVEIFTAKLIAAMRARGHEAVVVTSHSDLDLPDEDAHQDVPIYRMPFHSALVERDPAAFLSARQRVAKLKQSFAPDVVHINFSDPSVLFHLESSAAHPAPFLVTIHALREHAGGKDTLMGRMLGEAGWVVAVSKANMITLEALAPEIAGRSSVIYNGVEEPALAPSPLPSAAPRLVCLGRLVEDKGFDVALAAFAEMAPRYPQARLVIAGDGPARPGLEAQAKTLGIADAVEFTGWIAPESVAGLINSATLMLVPSRWEEPFGLVAVEAALMARPVVASRVGGLAEVVADGKTGLLVEKEHAAALASAIGQLLDNPAAAQKMGREARKRARSLFSLERQVDAYEALYQRLAEGNFGG